MKAADLVIGIQLKGAGDFPGRWIKALEARGAAVRILDLLGAKPLAEAAGCDGVMWHWLHYPHESRLAVLPILRVIAEHLHLPVFPDLATCWHYDDKVAQAYLLEALDIPHPQTWVFWRKADALAWCEQAAYPLVAKLACGAGSRNVRLIQTPRAAWAYVNQAFSGSGIVTQPALQPRRMARAWTVVKRAGKRLVQAGPYVCANRFPSLPDQTFWMPQKNHVLFQEFLAGNAYDTRVTVIGDRAFAYRRFNRPNDFRASGSGNFDVNPAEINPECIRTAFQNARKLQSQSMAFDFLFRPGDPRPLTGEISYCYVDWMVAKCPGHWDSELKWHAGSMWPEDAHVEDFLARILARRNP